MCSGCWISNCLPPSLMVGDTGFLFIFTPYCMSDELPMCLCSYAGCAQATISSMTPMHPCCLQLQRAPPHLASVGDLRKSAAHAASMPAAQRQQTRRMQRTHPWTGAAAMQPQPRPPQHAQQEASSPRQAHQQQSGWLCSPHAAGAASSFPPLATQQPLLWQVHSPHLCWEAAGAVCTLLPMMFTRAAEAVCWCPLRHAGAASWHPSQLMTQQQQQHRQPQEHLGWVAGAAQRPLSNRTGAVAPSLYCQTSHGEAACQYYHHPTGFPAQCT